LIIRRHLGRAAIQAIYPQRVDERPIISLEVAASPSVEREPDAIIEDGADYR